MNLKLMKKEEFLKRCHVLIGESFVDYKDILDCMAEAYRDGVLKLLYSGYFHINEVIDLYRAVKQMEMKYVYNAYVFDILVNLVVSSNDTKKCKSVTDLRFELSKIK